MVRKTIIVRIILGIIVVLFLYLLRGFLYPFYADVSNITVKGKVTDQFGHPKEGIKIILRNHYYTGGEYDSYRPSEKQATRTDSNGEYLFKLTQSAWIHVDTTDRMPSPVFQARYTCHLKKTMCFDFMLNE